jgi:seryl-tRNA synthetase
MDLRKMHKVVTIYQENKNSIGYFLKLFRLGKEKGVTPEQIMKLIQMADNIHKLQGKFQQLQSHVIEIGMKKSGDIERLEKLQNEIDAAQDKLNSVEKAFNMKYEELKEACSQAQRLQNYVERFKDGQDYQELEAIVRSEVVKILLDNKNLCKMH